MQPRNGFRGIALHASCNMGRMFDVGLSRFVHLAFMGRNRS